MQCADVSMVCFARFFHVYIFFICIYEKITRSMARVVMYHLQVDDNDSKTFWILLGLTEFI